MAVPAPVASLLVSLLNLQAEQSVEKKKVWDALTR